MEPSLPPSASAYVAPAKTNTLAIVSLVTGIASFVVGIFLPFILPIAAVISGHLARGQINRSEGREAGAGLALAGLILGYVWLAISAVLLLFVGGSVLALIGLD